MTVLLYLIYGSNRAYHLELTWAVLTAARYVRQDPQGARIVIASDPDNARPDLPAESMKIPPETLRAWQLDGTYNHAAKTFALREALRRFDCPVILMDSDTILKAPVRTVAARARPGSALLHKREGPLSESPEAAHWQHAIAATGGEVSGYAFGPDTVMHNAGVLGVSPQDLPLLDDAIAVMRALREVSSVFTVEQLATSLVLGARTRVAHCSDEVEHYWDGPRAYYRYQMDRARPEILRGDNIERPEEPLPELRRNPPSRRADRLAARVKRIMRGGDGAYAQAWLAYRSALATGRTDPALANVWAETALSMLRYGVGYQRPEAASDFSAFRGDAIDDASWMDTSLREEWRDFWSDPQR